MKKLPLIFALICTMILLVFCIFLNSNYQNLNNRFRERTTEAFNLRKDNSELSAKLESNATELKKKEQYIKGQNDYISELSQQIQSYENNDEEGTENTSYDFKNDPYPNLYANKDNDKAPDEKYVYLTFDDGPSDLTPKVLDLLDQYNAKATFFVVCKNNEDCARYLSEIVERGHTLALHSYSHNYHQIYQSVDAFLSDYEKVYDWVYKETGYSPFLFRFPGGSSNGSSSVVYNIIQEMDRRGFTFYDWNVSSGDGSNLTTTENIIDNICSNIGNVSNPVVLMHDGKGKNATLAALPTVLKNLADKGYEFRALDETSEPVQYR